MIPTVGNSLVKYPFQLASCILFIGTTRDSNEFSAYFAAFISTSCSLVSNQDVVVDYWMSIRESFSLLSNVAVASLAVLASSSLSERDFSQLNLLLQRPLMFERRRD